MATSIIVPTDSPSIFDSLSTLDAQALVSPNNPPPGIAGFLFDITGDEEVRLRSQIARHYVEANTPVQDMIALEPEEVRVRGLVAELSTGLPATPAPAAVPDTLPVNPAMAPEFSTQATQTMAAQAAATTAQSTSNQAGNSLYGYYLANSPQPPGQTNQSNAFAFFYQLWQAGALFTVDTPYGYFTNMAIQDLRAIQEAVSKERSEFTIIFQKVRVIGAVSATPGQLAGRRALQAAPTTNNGLAAQGPLTSDQSANLFSGFA